jgi:hypothetical protein
VIRAHKPGALVHELLGTGSRVPRWTDFSLFPITRVSFESHEVIVFWDRVRSMRRR